MKKNGPLWVTLAVVLVTLQGLLSNPFPPGDTSFGRLPVLNGGRVKPLDALARNSLLVLSGKQTLRWKGKVMSATHWLREVLFRPETADALPVFEINDPDVLGVLEIEQSQQRRYAFNDLVPHLEALDTQAQKAQKVPSERRSRFQSAVAGLQNKVILYQKLQNTLRLSNVEEWEKELVAFDQAVAEKEGGAPVKKEDPHGGAEILASFRDRYGFLAQAAEFAPLPVPQTKGEEPWVTVGTALLARFQAPAFHPALTLYARLGDAHRRGDERAFAGVATELIHWMETNAPHPTRRVAWEVGFNRFEPFYRATVLCLVVLLLVFVSFLTGSDPFRRTAGNLLIVAFVLQTLGLLGRMWIQGRPPVTNLYSSAIFVGWVAVFLGIVLERMYKNGFGALGAALVGFVTQIIAHHLMVQGDTLEMMRAVLDSNFWLATHVTTVTIGYSSTFLSGALGLVYVLWGLFGKKMTPEAGRSLARMAYGIVCFSTFFSFIGTVLGGIWADQSWGRFWGWDPKENGALMIVLWNALILHLKWGGFVRQRGLMVAVIFGNIITALSWFGVNMLGIGLHSYGFMDKAFPWLVAFTVSQVLGIALGLLPDRFWASRPWPVEPPRFP